MHAKNWHLIRSHDSNWFWANDYSHINNQYSIKFEFERAIKSMLFPSVLRGKLERSSAEFALVFSPPCHHPQRSNANVGWTEQLGETIWSFLTKLNFVLQFFNEEKLQKIKVQNFASNKNSLNSDQQIHCSIHVWAWARCCMIGGFENYCLYR
jgi:hypothetical protein